MANRKPTHPPNRTIRKSRRVRTGKESLQVEAGKQYRYLDEPVTVVEIVDGGKRALIHHAMIGMTVVSVAELDGPLVDPILEDEDDSDDSPLDGGAPKR